MNTTDYRIRELETQQQMLLDEIRRLERKLESKRSQLATVQHDLRRLWDARDVVKS